jgi:glycosyltransferase involved in cell wall biosynthesis
VPKPVRPDEAPGDVVDVYQAHKPEAIGTLAMVMRDNINAATVNAIMRTDWSFVPPERFLDRVFVQGNILTLNRNECIQRMEGDWIIFVDDDMVWEPDAIRRLIETRDYFDLDIVGALCHRRTYPHQPTMYMREAPDHGMYNFLESWENDVIEVDATGMAFCLIHKRVFERMVGMEMPSYEERANHAPMNFFRWEGSLGEDLRFCQEAKATGSKIFVDTRIKIKHVGEVQIGEREFLMALSERSPEAVAMRKEINDQMGLPTVTPEDARRALGWS